MNDVETSVHPPEIDEDEDGGGSPSTRLNVSFVGADDVVRDAGVQLFDTDATDPEKIADALLNAALACAQLAGPDVAWAAMHRFASYEGGAA